MDTKSSQTTTSGNPNEQDYCRQTILALRDSARECKMRIPQTQSRQAKQELDQMAEEFERKADSLESRLQKELSIGNIALN